MMTSFPIPPIPSLPIKSETHPEADSRLVGEGYFPSPHLRSKNGGGNDCDNEKSEHSQMLTMC